MFHFFKHIDHHRHTSAGSVLAVVLGLIALASFVLIAFMEEATAKIKYSGLFSNRDDLRVHAFSTLETTLAVINEIREIDWGLYGPAQGWGNPFYYARIEPQEDLDVEIMIEDETGKISLHMATQQTLNILFEEMGLSFDDSEELTDALLDWTDADDLTHLNGAESAFYDIGDHPYRPANQPLQSWDELRLIKGFDTLFFDSEGNPNDYYRQFLSAVSTYHNGKVNINSAGPLVLAVISRVDAIDTEGLYVYLIGDDGVRGTDDDRLIIDRNHPYFPGDPARGSRSGMVDMHAEVLNITVSVRRGESSFLLNAIVSWSGANPSAAATTAKLDPETSQTSQQKQPTMVDFGTVLGYPFQIMRLIENRRL